VERELRLEITNAGRPIQAKTILIDYGKLPGLNKSGKQIIKGVTVE
jgi:hypothetical protein